jgi:hypothetical protein
MARFSRANKVSRMIRASQSAEKLSEAAVLKGHGFIRANRSRKMALALAAEGWFFRAGVGISSFSATRSAPDPSFAGFAFRSEFFCSLFGRGRFVYAFDVRFKERV